MINVDIIKTMKIVIYIPNAATALNMTNAAGEGWSKED